MSDEQRWVVEGQAPSSGPAKQQASYPLAQLRRQPGAAVPHDSRGRLSPMTAGGGCPPRQPGAAVLHCGGASRDTAADALLDVLAKLYDALKRLAELAGEKLEALRRADAEALQRIARQEHEVLERIAALEPRRSAALARLAQVLRLEGEAAPTLSRLVEVLPQPLSSRLAARAAGLRDVATLLRDRNARAAGVARDLYRHFRGVLHEVARGCQETVGYGPDGPRQRQNQNWIDAVG